jgi:5-oxoprolinase (ATP-hydrolysing)
MSMRESPVEMLLISSSWPDSARPDGPRKETITKLLSQDPSNYPDAPTEGIRRILETVTGKTVPRGEPLPVEKIGEISHDPRPFPLLR